MIEKVQKLLKEELECIKKERQALKGDGRIYIRERKGNLYFSERVNGREIGITKNKKRVEILLRKTICKDTLVVRKKNYEMLKKTFEKLEKYQKEYNYSSIGIGGLNYSFSDWQWMIKPYERNPYYPERLKYTTTNEFKMRSKSEQAIANRLEARGIPYRPEAPLRFGDKIVYPDFMILLPSGDIVIWEHFGLMDDPEYKQKASEKIEEYRKCGFVQHKNLICTYEEDIKSAKDIDRIIDLFLC